MSNHQVKVPVYSDSRQNLDIEQFGIEAQKRWNKLTAQDLKDIAGSRALLSTKLQAEYGLTLQDADAQVAEFMAE